LLKKDQLEEVAGFWRNLDKEELQGLYFLPDIVGGDKSRRMRWVGHVSHLG
jgi:hypothetical protein